MASITEIQPTDHIGDSREVINDNFNALNAELPTGVTAGNLLYGGGAGQPAQHHADLNWNNSTKNLRVQGAADIDDPVTFRTSFRLYEPSMGPDSANKICYLQWSFSDSTQFDWLMRFTSVTPAVETATPLLAVVYDDATGVVDYVNLWPEVQFSNAISVNGAATFFSTVTLAQDPASALQAATKQYVDNRIRHFVAYVATTANITLSGTQTVDSFALVAGDIVLVKNQSTASENGVYVVAAGAWTQLANVNGALTNNTKGFTVFVKHGTQAQSLWLASPTDTYQKLYGFGELATHAALTAAHGVSGAIVGTTDTQKLTNKNIVTPHNVQTGTAYTAVLADASKLVTLDNASAITFTVPPNSSVAYDVGTTISFLQKGAGQVTVAPGSGVTVNSRGSALKTAGQHAMAVLHKIAMDTWILSGDITA